MNIYFACSITGGREFEPVYRVLTNALLQAGHEVPTAHLAQPDIIATEGIVSPEDVYERDVTWIRAADALVAEVSVPSHGVGYEVAYALGLGKPVVCLYRRDRKLSKMISGNPDSHLQVRAYADDGEALQILACFLEEQR